MKFSVSDVWDSVGDAREGHLSSIWLAKLVGETFLECLEFGTGTRVSDVVSAEGMKQLHFGGC